MIRIMLGRYALASLAVSLITGAILNESARFVLVASVVVVIAAIATACAVSVVRTIKAGW